MAEICYNIINSHKGDFQLQYTFKTREKDRGLKLSKFLKNHKDFELTDINVPNLDIFKEGKLCTFYPNLTHTEGFFIGRLIKK